MGAQCRQLLLVAVFQKILNSVVVGCKLMLDFVELARMLLRFVELVHKKLSSFVDLVHMMLLSSVAVVHMWVRMRLIVEVQINLLLLNWLLVQLLMKGMLR